MSRTISHVSGSADNCKYIAIPQEIYDDLLAMASELNFKHRGHVAVMPMLEALSQLEPEQAYDVFREHGLLPKSGSINRAYGANQ